MQIKIKNFSGSIPLLLKNCGYSFDKKENNEYSFIRRLSRADYPRFHAYVSIQETSLFINLHLDQKKPSYEGTTAHSGEYEGELITKEKLFLEKIAQKFVSQKPQKLNPW